jgi:flagellin-like hook-associated protein FlgL
MTPFVRLLNILNQTGISALAQANQMQQGVLSLLR